MDFNLQILSAMKHNCYLLTVEEKQTANILLSWMIMCLGYSRLKRAK
jgi:hypothetical protein